MARPTSGSVTKVETKDSSDRKVSYWQVRFTGMADGKRKDVRKRLRSKTAATALLAELKRKHSAGTLGAGSEKITFRQLADRYEKAELVPASYRDGRKIRGYRESNLGNLKRILGVLREYFGNRQLRTISPGDLESFKRDRLDAPITRKDDETKPSKVKQKGSPRYRTIATVNRELALLRTVLRWAVRHNLLESSPFDKASKLISPADEKKRQHILTRDEENRLLTALGKETVCVGRGGKHPDEPETRRRREHIRPLVIFLLDTACRYGEAARLTWGDIEESRIRIRAENSKTLRERFLPISGRLAKELALLKLQMGGKADPESRVFTAGYPRTAFQAACKDAGLPTLRLHDLRHTAITRLVEQGLPLAQAMEISGHTQIQTALRYVGTTENTLDKARQIFDSYAADAVVAN